MEEKYSKLGAPISPTNVIINSKVASESVRSEMEIGSSSRQVEVVWRRNEMENANGCVQMELIDIPVKHGEAKKPLAEISSKASIQENTGKGKGSRKWKRVERKLGEQPGKGVFGMNKAANCGTKRSWSLIDENDEENLSLKVMDKRLRMEHTGHLATKEVVVASLD